jgi:type I restriction enzyme S subunit
MPKVNRETLSEIRIPVPEPETQRAIADFLDAETARIDALITAKENLLAILAEKRRALITQTVTRGLDPHVPLRDSGIPWLGEIPAHWEDVRLRFLVDRIEQGWSPQADASEPTADEWGVLKLSAVSRGKFDPGAAKAMPSELEPRIEYEVREGDFLLTRANTPSRVGDACFVETTRPMLMLCDLIYRLRLRGDRIRGKYLCHFLVLPIGRTQIEADARGTSNSMVKISQEHIKGWRVPVPPVEEQVAIVEFLDRETGALDEMERATLLTVRLLRERREAVIAAAVTGQFPLESLSSQETAP